MDFDGLDAQAQLLRDLAVRSALANELQHLALARGEAAQAGRVGSGARHLARAQALADIALALKHRADGVEQLVGVAGLEYEPGRARFEQLLEHALVAAGGN